jgi:hypothetical protein
MEMERRDTEPRGERLEIDVLVQPLLDFDQQRNEALFFSFHGRFAAGGATSVRKGHSMVNWTLASRACNRCLPRPLGGNGLVVICMAP